MALYQVQAQVISTRPGGRTSIGIPTFWVCAECAEHAVIQAHLVLAADARDDDERQIELSGSVVRDEDRADYACFSYRRHEPQPLIITR